MLFPPVLFLEPAHILQPNMKHPSMRREYVKVVFSEGTIWKVRRNNTAEKNQGTVFFCCTMLSLQK